MRELAKQVQRRNGCTIRAQLTATAEFKGALGAYSRTFETMKPAGEQVDWVYLDPLFDNFHRSDFPLKRAIPMPVGFLTTSCP